MNDIGIYLSRHAKSLQISKLNITLQQRAIVGLIYHKSYLLFDIYLMNKCGIDLINILTGNNFHCYVNGGQ